ncbi:B9 domain-containing protein 2 [Phlebotomus papatasi]|uniref:B9 domain-containing protein 2 n=1 Tax=Phlebotomus papatasi TaxID=29031 RepID=A0A1B0DQJ6_PHLPP|nr:B9 domain-containing protein 2 [Phlebotomus papatasi]
MAELHIIGQILDARDFEEENLLCKWSFQIGSTWKVIEGLAEGQTATDSNRVEKCSVFSHPLDLHLSTRGIQGWPKLHVEIWTANALKQCWPVGFGVLNVPTHPGIHNLTIPTWRIAPSNIWDALREKFHGGGVALARKELVYSQSDRYKLSTTSTAGSVGVELMLIFKNFKKFGVEF